MNKVELFGDKSVKLFASVLFFILSLCASCLFCEDENSFGLFWKNFAYVPLFVFSVCLINCYRNKEFLDNMKEKIYDSVDYQKFLLSFGYNTEKDRYEPFFQFVQFRDSYVKLLLLVIPSIILSIVIENVLFSLVVCLFCAFVLFVSIWFVNVCIHNDKALSYYEGIKFEKYSNRNNED